MESSSDACYCVKQDLSQKIASAASLVKLQYSILPVIGDDAAYVIHRGHHRDHTARLLAGVFHKGTTVGIATFVDDICILVFIF